MASDWIALDWQHSQQILDIESIAMNPFEGVEGRQSAPKNAPVGWSGWGVPRLLKGPLPQARADRSQHR